MTSIENDFPLADREIPIGMLVRAYNDLRAKAIRLERVVNVTARMNPNAGEIGAGMLVQIVDASRKALKN